MFSSSNCLYMPEVIDGLAGLIEVMLAIPLTIHVICVWLGKSRAGTANDG